MIQKNSRIFVNRKADGIKRIVVCDYKKQTKNSIT